MAKVLIISNLSLNTIVDSLKSELSKDNISVEFRFQDDIAGYLWSHKETINKFAFCLIHTDLWFDQDEHALIDIYRAILDLSKSVMTQFLLPNQCINYPTGSWDKFRGKHIEPLSIAVETGLCDIPNVTFYDIQSEFAFIGLKNCYHYKLGYLYQMPYKKEAQQRLVKVWNQVLSREFNDEKKVIVLDCDNTLWGGIVGEDGLDGIRISKNEDGILYLHFQKFLKKKKDDGFLLCLASKNNLKDVQEVFENRAMPLKWDDFVAVRINWKDKHINIREIANSLNLGLSSMIFVDDNSYEIDFVKSQILEISTLLFKPEAEHINDLMNNALFGKKHILVEDRKRTVMYLQNAKREMESYKMSREAYIRSLEIIVSFNFDDELNIERLAQLTEKTNQFNFNKRAMSKHELLAFITLGNVIISASVKDKYGEYGIVGLMLIRKIKAKEAVLENFILSCRALGRDIEDSFILELEKYLLSEGIELSDIVFVETERNIPAKEFYINNKKISQWIKKK
jgi:FkbH-like protein